MVSSDYVLGVLDVLVKAGEVSPAYATGVADTVIKQAYSDWGSDIQEALKEYIEKNPKAVDSDGALTITPAEARAIVNDARPWGLPGDRFTSEWWRNKWGKHVTRRLNSTSKPPELYDYELRDLRNKQLTAAMQKHLSGPLSRLLPELAGGVQDQHVHDARQFANASRKVVHPNALARAGLDDPEAYADKFRTRQGTSAIDGGVYKAVHDKPGARSKISAPRPGVGNPTYYGSRNKNFYTNPYKNPLSK